MDDVIELAYGAGGLLMHQLIDGVIRAAFVTPGVDLSHDGVVLNIEAGDCGFRTGAFSATTDTNC